MKDFRLRDIACFEYLAGEKVRAPKKQESKEKTENRGLLEKQSIKEEQNLLMAHKSRGDKIEQNTEKNQNPK